MGHRNPQGLFYDTKNNYVLSTEHGPEGGDEINFIDVNNKNIPNYGWPISSYGTRYYSENMKAKPFETSHKLFNFSEPLYSFIPSIGISGLGTCPDNLKKYYNDIVSISKDIDKDNLHKLVASLSKIKKN